MACKKSSLPTPGIHGIWVHGADVLSSEGERGGFRGVCFRCGEGESRASLGARSPPGRGDGYTGAGLGVLINPRGAQCASAKDRGHMTVGKSFPLVSAHGSRYTTLPTGSYDMKSDYLEVGGHNRMHNTTVVPVVRTAAPPSVVTMTTLPPIPQVMSAQASQALAPLVPSAPAKPACCKGCAAGKGCEGKDDCYLCKAMRETAAEGRQELQSLNNRLVSILQVTKQQSLDTSMLSELQVVIKEMREETGRLQGRYEAEIKQLMVTMERNAADSSKDKAEIAAMADKIKRLEDELGSWKLRYRELELNLESSEEKRTDHERELVELRAKIRNIEAELEQYRKDKGENHQEIGRITALYSQERERVIAGNKRVETLELQLDGINGRYQQERIDWQRKVCAFEKTIQTLELKIKEITEENSTGRFDIDALVSQLRDMFQKDIEGSQRKTREAMEKDLAGLEKHFSRAGTDVTIDPKYKDVQAEARKYKQRVVEMEGMMKGYQDQIKSLEADIAKEREQYAAKVRDLETKMAHFYKQYLSKTEECSLAREGQMALKAEIAALGAIIEAEERRKHSQGQHGQHSRK